MFSIVIPIRGTVKELKFMEKSIPSAIRLNPDEIVFGVDDHNITEKIKDICKKYNFTRYTFVIVEKDDSWNFQLANVVWKCYKHAANDVILSFDVDSVLTSNVLLGLDNIGRDGVAVLSFTKKLLIKSIGDVIKYMTYRARVKKSDYVFSGVYWVYRPYFFELIKQEDYKKIRNGVDTFLTDTVLASKYKIITRKEIGVKSLDIQNEDYPWRQFQTGIWIRANEYIPTSDYKTIKNIRLINWRNASLLGIMVLFLRLFVYRNPKSFIYTKAFLYNQPFLVKGFNWADKNMESESVQVAKKLNYNEWGYNGSEYLPKMDWGRMGTGY